MAINIKKRPVLTEIVKVWTFNSDTRVMVGLDNRGDVWIVESCPAGSWAWDPSEIRQVKNGRISAKMYAEPLKLAERLMRAAAEVNRTFFQPLDDTACAMK